MLRKTADVVDHRIRPVDEINSSSTDEIPIADPSVSSAKSPRRTIARDVGGNFDFAAVRFTCQVDIFVASNAR
ncbi:MAG: hypothetical protein ACLPVY_19445 [Acidimicrobiia bacterium]